MFWCIRYADFSPLIETSPLGWILISPAPSENSRWSWAIHEDMDSVFSILVKELTHRSVWTIHESLAEELDTSTVLWLLHAENAMTVNKIGNFRECFIRDFFCKVTMQNQHTSLIPINYSLDFRFTALYFIMAFGWPHQCS